MDASFDNNMQLIHEFGLSLPEYYILGTVGYDIVVPPDELVRITFSEVKGDIRGEFATEVYVAAIRSCIEKGWLKILDDSDCERDEQRRRQEPHPICNISVYEPGCVEFTEEGASRYIQLCDDLAKLCELTPERVGWNSEQHGLLDLYGDTETSCAQELQEIVAYPESYLGECTHITSVSGIQPCGSWWISRFELIPEGFHVRIRYEFD